MFKLLNRKQSGSLTGIFSGDSGTAIACVERQDKDRVALQSCEFSPAGDSAAGPFAGLQGHNLDKQACSTLLSIGDYQLLVVDAPEVPPEEMRAAIRWHIQDMIDFHVDDAVLDVFDAPPAGPANSKQLYVVVARTDKVKLRIDALEQAGINLEIIDIPELAMRNIASCLPEDEAGLVSLYFGKDLCLITITHNAVLYLTRSIDIGYKQLEEAAASPQSLCNRIALEVQRSMDYYEHNYHQAAARAVAILPVPVILYGLVDALEQTLGLTTRMINVGDILDSDIVLDDAHAADCLLAIGSALRTEALTL